MQSKLKTFLQCLFLLLGSSSFADVGFKTSELFIRVSIQKSPINNLDEDTFEFHLVSNPGPQEKTLAFNKAPLSRLSLEKRLGEIADDKLRADVERALIASYVSKQELLPFSKALICLVKDAPACSFSDVESFVGLKAPQ